MPAFVVNQNFINRQHAGDVAARVIAFESDTIKICVLNSTGSAALDKTTDDDLADVSGNEISSATGYTAGHGNRLTVDNVTVTLATNTITIDHDDETVAQSASGFADGRALVYYKETGTADASCQIIGHVIAGSDFGNVDGPLTIAPGANGIIGITES